MTPQKGALVSSDWMLFLVLSLLFVGSIAWGSKMAACCHYTLWDAIWHRPGTHQGWDGTAMAWMLVLLVVLGETMFYNETVKWPRYSRSHHCEFTGQSKRILSFCGKAPCYITHDLYRCDGEKFVWH